MIYKHVMGGFYGELTFKLESGNIVYVKECEIERVVTAQASSVVDKAVADHKEVSIRESPRSEGISLVHVTTQGSLEEVVPIIKE